MPANRQRPKVAEVVANWLRRPIVTGEMPEGAAFPTESQLTEQFGVSRPTVREAMRILESEGLVVVHRGIGGGARARRPEASAVARAAGFVLQERGTTLGDVFACREFLEVPAIGLLLQRQDREEGINRLEAALAAAEDAAADDQGTPVPEGDFHRVLVEEAKSPTLELYAAITNQIIHTHTRNYMHKHRTEPRASTIGDAANAAHRRLVTLLKAGDLVGAQQHWRDHLRSTSEIIVPDQDVPVSLLGEPIDPRHTAF
ncbi:GntR family transcriptional regulator [Rhodococcus rhodochrous]|uniref:FadR/GntR family transcriptional regulator n=1 Tax=Rhodococcus rhodochrous TaxID=1829 RepID=UPI001E3A4710|nr:GntR family transcriptional regulator [Rhodococcus rhodochrous]MCB8913983.1 GntR family transcriptional regulator [Rhodococcus rhodochrous]